MTPYKRDARCPKCRSLAVTSRYCQVTDSPVARMDADGTVGRRCARSGGYAPHMHRLCQNCGHEFFQIPADADADEYTPEKITERAERNAQRMKDYWDTRLGLTLPSTTMTVERPTRSWWKP